MQHKQNTVDIDRKLTIYYHPLFQQILRAIQHLFTSHYDSQFTLGMIDFVEFNIKLQKALLPSFEIQDAMASALNDWVKEIAECVGYQGMISTSLCEEVTTDNLQRLLEHQIKQSLLSTHLPTHQYLVLASRMASHDAFKLLNVRISRQVFNKFVFDLCSTWCEFLDVELFAMFTIGMYLQISQGQHVERSKFRTTKQIQPLGMAFMKEMEMLKARYSQQKRKQLRYYRAWCQWNYLRVNQVGEQLIILFRSLFQDEQGQRILELAMLFQRAIQIINEEIITQSGLRKSNDSEPLPPTQSMQLAASNQSQGFLIMKKLNVKTEVKERRDGPNQSKEYAKSSEDQPSIQQPQVIQPTSPQPQPHRFSIQIDAAGNMYLIPIVRLPVMGTQIAPQSTTSIAYINAKLEYFRQKGRQMRQVSNLYERTKAMKIKLEHNVQRDKYYPKVRKQIRERDRFYRKDISGGDKGLGEAIHERSYQGKDKQLEKAAKPIIGQQMQTYTNQPKPLSNHPSNTNPTNKSTDPYRPTPITLPPVSDNPAPLRQLQTYIHKVMAPSFLTSTEHNPSYSLTDNHVYSNSVCHQKRDLKLGVAKMGYLGARLRAQTGSYHVVGKLITDREAINEKVKRLEEQLSSSHHQKGQHNNTDRAHGNLNQSFKDQSAPWNPQPPSLTSLPDSQQFLLRRYLPNNQLDQLTDPQMLYRHLAQAKHKFALQFQSAYRFDLPKQPQLYENMRYQLGGVITQKDQERFSERMKRLFKREEKRMKGKRGRKIRNRQYRSHFKNKNQKQLFQGIFLDYHKGVIKEIKEDRKKAYSLIEG